MPSICPTCSCTEIDYVDISGDAVCVSCGTILETNNIVSSVEFQESGGGHSVVGQFVSSTTSHSTNVGTSGRNYGVETRAATLSIAKRKIRQVAGMLRLGEHYVESAYRLYALALQRSFTHGRKSQTVIATCLYVVCRRERSPHLLIDFADKLQVSVYALGGVFLKFCKLLQIHLPLIDPSLYIHRFASQLKLGSKTHTIATTALRLVATMKRDWMETGRRPSGICGAALLIAARSHSVVCGFYDVMDVVSISERTLQLRLEEFSMTPTAQLTYDQVGKLEMARVECDPPCFQRHRQREVMDLLLAESQRLAIEQQRKRSSSVTSTTKSSDLVVKSPARKVLSSASHFASVVMKDEEIAKLLNGGETRSKVSRRDAISDDEDEEDAVGLEADEEEDFGFENENDQIVTRASRQAAKETLHSVRKKSARFIVRRQREMEFYRTIERDLTLALEEEPSKTIDDPTKFDDSQKQSEQGADDRTSKNGKEAGEEQEEEDEYDEEKIEQEDPRENRSFGAGTDNTVDEIKDDDHGDSSEDTLSDIDDAEIDALLLTREEVTKKQLLWEKMNKEYLEEQEKKRLEQLNAANIPHLAAPKKKKRKKPQADAKPPPPPDTAQHAIYRLKSRRINYDVIDELFGVKSH